MLTGFVAVDFVDEFCSQGINMGSTWHLMGALAGAILQIIANLASLLQGSNIVSLTASFGFSRLLPHFSELHSKHTAPNPR